MSKRVLLSSHYFPCITYFAYALKYETNLMDTGEHFVKQSYRNRCIIYTANGPLSLSVPVIKKNKMPMKEVLIDSTEDWKTNHWRAICSAYNGSPFFEFYSDDLKNILFKEYTSLVELNKTLTKHICSELGIKNPCKTSESYVDANDSDIDLRDSLHPKKSFVEIKKFPRYIQIFEEKHGFQKNLSILDLLFHEGPESLNYLSSLL